MIAGGRRAGVPLGEGTSDGRDTGEADEGSGSAILVCPPPPVAVRPVPGVRRRDRGVASSGRDAQEDGRQHLNPPGARPGHARQSRDGPQLTDRDQPDSGPVLHDRTMPADGTDVSGRARRPGSLSPRTASPPGRRSTRPWVSSGGRRSEADALVGVPKQEVVVARLGGEFPHIPRRRTRRYELGTKPGFSTLGGNSHDFPAGSCSG